jgi:hypothetical protein
MHRSITASIPAQATQTLVQKLISIEHVLSVGVSEGESKKPTGDVVTVHLLNRGSDEVLRAIAAVGRHGEFAVVTGLADSLSNPGKQHQIDHDVDEGIWEEMESGLVHHGRLTINYLLLMALGGIIGGAGLGQELLHAATALIAASIIAPAYEPLAKIPLALVLRRWPILRHACLSAAVGYTTLILSAAVTVGILTSIGGLSEGAIETREFVKHVIDPTAGLLVISAAGAAAGAIMITAFRETVLAGPLIAIALIITAVLAGAGIATGDSGLVIGGLKRLLLEVFVVILLGLIVFGLKRLTTHRRDPIV